MRLAGFAALLQAFHDIQPLAQLRPEGPVVCVADLDQQFGLFRRSAFI